MKIDGTYKNHKVFEQLSIYAEFYKDLSDSVMSFVSPGIKPSPHSIFNIDTYVYSSIQGTLESIKSILIQRRINDSYALLRKYYDAAIINIYSILYLDDHIIPENFVVDQINNWLEGKEKLPEYRVMSRYIRYSGKLAKINKLLHNDETYKKLRDRCNDNTHYNFYYNLMLNINELHSDKIISILNTFSIDLENIFILHLSYLFYIKDYYMTSSDYLDSLECGLTPEEGSQYDVAPFIQEIFDSVIKRNRMDLAIEIKNNTAMRLE